MIYAVCFKDNHIGKQTHEKEAVSESCFPVKAFFQSLGLDDCSAVTKPTVVGRRPFFFAFSAQC